MKQLVMAKTRVFVVAVVVLAFLAVPGFELRASPILKPPNTQRQVLMLVPPAVGQTSYVSRCINPVWPKPGLKKTVIYRIFNIHLCYKGTSFLDDSLIISYINHFYIANKNKGNTQS
jgi:hypothetical protein